MKVLGDDVEEGGDGPFDALLIIATAMSLMALLVVLALTHGSGGNMGDGNSRSDDRRNRSSEEPADANNIVLEFQDELVLAEEGLLDSTPPERRPQKKQVHSIAHQDIIEKRIDLHADIQVLQAAATWAQRRQSRGHALREVSSNCFFYSSQIQF